MKIILVGASGTLGQWLSEAFSEHHEVVSVGRNSGDVRADMTEVASIRNMYAAIGGFDALVCAAGHGYFGPFEEMSDTEFRQGIDSKLMGQINLVLEGRHFVREGGSFTLISGILADDPVPMASNLSAVNGALNAFAKAAAIELLPRGLRINVVSPGLVEASAASLGSYFPGHVPVSHERTVAGYRKSVEGRITGEVIRIY